MVNKLCRRGFSMIEAIVVAGSITVLCAIIFPVIQSCREAARLNQCKDRLQQIGLALHNYHETFGTTFPAGFVVGGNDPYQGWSWSVFLAPYLNESAWYNTIDFQNGLQAESLQPSLHAHLSKFRCPSDTGGDIVSAVSIVTEPVVDWRVEPGSKIAKNVFSRSNYFGSDGFLHDYAGGIKSDDPATSTRSDANLNQGSLGTPATKYSLFHQYVDQENFGGVFGQNSQIGIPDIRDGTSNTMLVGERYTPRAAINGQPVIGDGAWLAVPDPTTAAGLAMSLGDTSIDIKLNIKGQPTTGFGSNHQRGTNVLFADGTVRIIGQKMDFRMYRMMSGIDDGFPKSCGF